MATRALDLGRPSPRPNLRGGSPQRSPRPTAAPARPRTDLKVVARPRVRSARQGRRLLITTCTFLTIVLAFGVAASQVFVAQNQARIDHMNAELKVEQARYDRLRFDVAELESPERIVAAAHDRLGMIEPPEVTYVAPVASNAPVATDDDSATAPDWRNVKSELAAK